MASVNKVFLIGHLGADPEMKYLSGGQAVANFSLATSNKWKDKNTGEQQEKTQWHKVTLWGRVAEVAKEYLKKGSLVFISGRIEYRQYDDKEGITRYVTEIIGSELQMIGGKPKQESTQEEAPF